MQRLEKIDKGSFAVMLITLILFVIALFARGLTHDLLLEAGVFLVSVKLILMAYANKITTDVLLGELREIKGKLDSHRSEA
jgi:hypothetical protein